MRWRELVSQFPWARTVGKRQLLDFPPREATNRPWIQRNLACDLEHTQVILVIAAGREIEHRDRSCLRSQLRRGDDRKSGNRNVKDKAEPELRVEFVHLEKKKVRPEEE